MNAIQAQQNKRWIEYLKGEREYDTIYDTVPKAHAFKEPWKNPRWSD